jgi:hypothetical protein
MVYYWLPEGRTNSSLGIVVLFKLAFIWGKDHFWRALNLAELGQVRTAWKLISSICSERFDLWHTIIVQ